MAQTRFTCILTKADEPPCNSYARVTITDSEGVSARGCPHHAAAALDGITGAHIDWADSKGLNQWERNALELSEERSRLSASWGRWAIYPAQSSAHHPSARPAGDPRPGLTEDLGPYR